MRSKKPATRLAYRQKNNDDGTLPWNAPHRSESAQPDQRVMPTTDESDGRRPMDPTQRAAWTAPNPHELHQYANACGVFVNGITPEALVGNYTGHLAMHHELLIPLLTRLIPPHASVLDFGCGVGRVTGVLSQIARTVIGADISAVALSRASRIVPTAVFCMLPGEGTLPFAPESFDWIVSMICLQHIQFFPVRHRYIQSFRRVLRPHGRMLLQFNASGGGECIRWYDRGTPDTYLAPDVVCDESEIVPYLTGEGFTVVDTWRTNSDSQEVSWDRCPRRTTSEWLWVVAEKAPTPDDPCDRKPPHG